MMKKTLLAGLLLLSIFARSQYADTIYINPSGSGFEDGSINFPFHHIQSAEIASNNCFLIKKGTTMDVDEPVVVDSKENIKIGAYGEGTRPKLFMTISTNGGLISIQRCVDIVVEDLDLNGFMPDAPGSGVKIVGHYISGQTKNILVKNCNVANFFNGIRMLPANENSSVSNITIDGCEIHHISEDGIFGQYVDDLTVRNSHIYFVNLDWHYQGHTEVLAPGDCIQLSYDCDNFLIENCILDRRYTGLKFCFIHNSDNGGYGNDGIIRDCIFYPPKDTVGAPSAGGAWLFQDGDSLLIERCVVMGRERLYSNDHVSVGEIKFDHVILRNILGDSVHNLKTSLENITCVAEHLTFATAKPNASIVDLSGGNTTLRNSAVAGIEDSWLTFGITTMENCHIYEGPPTDWNTEFGWNGWATGDYHLTENSPLIDQGTTSGSLIDLDGISVPQGDAPDIGCYEYGTSSTINPLLPEADFYSESSSIYEGQEVAFYDQSLNNPTSWHWYFPGGNPELSTSQNPVVQYKEPGDFSVTLMVLNQDGQNIRQKEDFIEVLDNYNAPVAHFSVDKQVAYTGEYIQFTSDCWYVPKNYVWYFEGAVITTSAEKNPQVRYLSPGKYDVKLGVVNDHGKDVLTKTEYVEIINNPNIPVADFSTEFDTYSTNDEVKFFDESENIPLYWYWFLDGALPFVSLEQNPVVKYPEAGTYKVRLYVANMNGFDIKEVVDYITIVEE